MKSGSPVKAESPMKSESPVKAESPVESESKSQEKPNSSSVISKCVAKLSCMRGVDWLSALEGYAVSDRNVLAFYEKNLREAEQGIDCCMDERGVRGGADRLKPKFVGGALGWAVLFILTGSDRVSALEKTRKLYEKNGWGAMEVHIDDHGCSDDESLAKRNQGCGFSGVWREAGEATKQLIDSEIALAAGDYSEGSDLIAAFREAGAVVTSLAGDHKSSTAHVLINFHEGKTLNPADVYGDNPAFSWDIWATTNDKVLESFQELSGTRMTKEHFTKLQALLHLTTGILLGAVRLDGDRNIILLKSASD